jgi:hypothetical protein
MTQHSATLKVLSVVTGIVFLTSCATVFKGSNEPVNLNSDPPGATVYLNGQPLGKTPTQVSLESKNTYFFEFRKEGYESRSVLVNHSVGAGWVVLDVIFLLFLVPIIVDAVTGDWYYLEPTTVGAALEPKAGAPVPAPPPTPAPTPAQPTPGT